MPSSQLPSANRLDCYLSGLAATSLGRHTVLACSIVLAPHVIIDCSIIAALARLAPSNSALARMGNIVGTPP